MTVTVKARNLTPHTWLADGALIIHLSFQRTWVYAQILTEDGHARTRRYRHDKDVKVGNAPTADPAA